MSDIIGLIGIIAAIAILIITMARGVTLFVCVCLSTVVLALTCGMPVSESVFTYFLAGASGFFKSYFLLFVLGALFSKLYQDGGGARRLALGLAAICGKSEKLKKYLTVWFCPLVYLVLTYVGIAGFVIIFCVVPIAKDLFQKNDVPWRLFTFGGAGMFATMFLTGSLSGVHIASANAAGVTTTTESLMSVVAAVVYMIFLGIAIKIELSRAEKKGESFMDTGKEIIATQSQQFDDAQLPNMFLAVLPLIVVILLPLLTGMDVQLALGVGCVLCAAIYYKNLKGKYKPCMSAGVSSGFVSLGGVCAVTGMITLMKVCPGFNLVLGAFDWVPPMPRAILLVSLMALISGTPVTGPSTMGATAIELFNSVGISNGVGFRLMNMGFQYGACPWSSGCANQTLVAKVKFTDAVKCYMWGFLVNFLTTVVLCILVSVGVFT